MYYYIAEKACQIIKVCAILWNFVLEHDGLEEGLDDKDDTAEARDRTPAPALWKFGDHHDQGAARRRRVAEDFKVATRAQDI